MIKPILSGIAAALVFSILPAAAQETETGREAAIAEAKDRAAMLADRLSVTEEQRPEVENILRQSSQNRTAILANFGFAEGQTPDLSRDEKRALRDQLKALSVEVTAQLETVLTDKQMTEYAKIQEEQQDEIREMMKK